jgi:hypothetical protein
MRHRDLHDDPPRRPRPRANEIGHSDDSNAVIVGGGSTAAVAVARTQRTDRARAVLIGWGADASREVLVAGRCTVCATKARCSDFRFGEITRSACSVFGRIYNLRDIRHKRKY